MLSRYNCIFIQIPRTGCGSINSILQQPGGHRPASYYRNKLSAREWSKRLKFTVVRNPYDRYASMLAHFKGVIPEHIKSQSYYVDETLNYIIHFESLQRQWSDIAELLKAPEQLPHENKSEKRPLTEDQRAFVRKEYAEDFRRFGYDSSL